PGLLRPAGRLGPAGGAAPSARRQPLLKPGPFPSFRYPAMSTPERNLHPVDLSGGWTPDSWRTRPALQMPTYPDQAALERALAELRHLPPLVTSWEILALKRQLAEAQEGKRFLLQGGDCAENFADCESGTISNRLKVLLQMSLVLVHGLRLPVVRVGRFAGQYAKPRSADMETRGEVSLPSYR